MELDAAQNLGRHDPATAMSTGKQKGGYPRVPRTN